MSNTIPKLQVDSDVDFRLQGFSDQEPWGRWGVGKTSSIEFTINKPETLSLSYQGVLPFSEQRLVVYLNGISIGDFRQPPGNTNTRFAQKFVFNASPGTQKISFSTNHSLIDQPNNTLNEYRDLSVSFEIFKINIPERIDILYPHSNLPLNSLYGVFPNLTTPIYLPAGDSGLSFFLKQSTTKELKIIYALLPTYSGQKFNFFLDGEQINQVFHKGSGLVKGELKIGLVHAGAHRVDIRSTRNKTNQQIYDYLRANTSLENNQVLFYVNSLEISPIDSKSIENNSILYFTFIIITLISSFIILYILLFRPLLLHRYRFIRK